MAVFVFIAMLPHQASAAESETLQKISDGAVSIELEIPQASKEKLSSLQLSLELVNQDGAPINAESLKNIENLQFDPDEEILAKAKICEQRYHKETGQLTIYLAGNDALFSDHDQLTMGTVTAVINNKDAADVYVKVSDDSLKAVKGITLKIYSNAADIFSVSLIKVIQNPGITTPPDTTQTPPEETKNPGATQTPPEETKNPDATTEPGATLPNETKNPDATQTPGTNPAPQETNAPGDITIQDPTKPDIDRSRLQEALKIAESLQESDYTAESFAQLKKAVADGKNVLNNANATQEEMDQATEAILNAIGALVLRTGTSADAINSATPADRDSATVKSGSKWTGDASNAVFCIVLLALSAAAVAVVTIKKKMKE